jgi:hypothetical protein
MMNDRDYLQKLVASTPKRLTKVTENDGWTTTTSVYLFVSKSDEETALFVEKKVILFLFKGLSFLRR